MKERFSIPAWVGIILAVTLGVSAGADVSLPKITWHMSPGLPVTMRTNDGRVATMKVVVRTSPSLTIPFKIIDNTCTNRQGMTCQYKAQFRVVQMSMVWTENPDNAKIGKIAQVGTIDNPGSFTDMSTIIQLSGLDQRHGTSITKGLMPHQIECQDFSWLPGGNKQAPQSLHAGRWDAEDNVQNTETGSTLNATSSSIYDVDMVQTAPQTLAVTSIGSVTNFLQDGYQLFLIDDSNSISFKNNDGQTCQVGASQEVPADVTRLLDKLVTPPDNWVSVPDYMSFADELLDVSQAVDFLSSWESTSAQADGVVQ